MTVGGKDDVCLRFLSFSFPYIYFKSVNSFPHVPLFCCCWCREAVVFGLVILAYHRKGGLGIQTLNFMLFTFFFFPFAPYCLLILFVIVCILRCGEAAIVAFELSIL